MSQIANVSLAAKDLGSKVARLMRISSMTTSEVDAIGELAIQCGFHLELALEMERKFAHIWVARFDADSIRPDAFLLAWQAADELDIIALGTAAYARRLGLARALVGELLQFAVNNAMHRLLLEVRNSNAAAIHLYQSLGFQTGRIREAYYSDPTEDGIEMSLIIDALGCGRSMSGG